MCASPGRHSGDARSIALKALRLFRRQDVFIQSGLDRIARKEGVRPADLALATELALGVMRHRLTLRHLAGQFLRGRWENFKPELQDALMLGAYQLIYLERVPAFAAVNKTVELAKTIGGRPAGGLTNAVLRELLRHREPADFDHAAAPPTHRLETAADQFVAFDIAILPDPQSDWTGYLSLATSHPTWLVGRWVKTYGRQGAEQICRYGMRRPEIFLRPNRLRISPTGLAAKLVEEKAAATLDADRQLIHLQTGTPVARSQAFRDGLFQPQDPTAKSVVDLARPQPGQTILDLCAAPGTKCTYAAELMQDRGLILAADQTEARLGLIEENTRRLGISIVQTCLGSEVASRLQKDRRPDIIFVDAPCSNTGVLARRPEARYRLRPGRLGELAENQQELLAQAAAFAGPDTRIVYSTCSIETEENEGVIEAFCRRHGSLAVQDSQLTLPDAGRKPLQWHDGGFAAVLAGRPAGA